MAANAKPPAPDRGPCGLFGAWIGLIAVMIFAGSLSLRAEQSVIWDLPRTENDAKWEELRVKHSAEWAEIRAKHRSDWKKYDTAKQEADDAFWEAVRAQIQSPGGGRNAEWNTILTKREEEWDLFRAELVAIRARQSAEAKATLAQQKAELEATLNLYIEEMSNSN